MSRATVTPKKYSLIKKITILLMMSNESLQKKKMAGENFLRENQRSKKPKFFIDLMTLCSFFLLFLCFFIKFY